MRRKDARGFRERVFSLRTFKRDMIYPLTSQYIYMRTKTGEKEFGPVDCTHFLFICFISVQI